MSDSYSNELTLESLAEYLHWKFPQRPIEHAEGQLRRILADFDHREFRILSDLESAIERFKLEIEEIGKAVDKQDLLPDEVRPAAYDAVWAAALECPRMLAGSGFPLHWREAIDRARRRRRATGD